MVAYVPPKQAGKYKAVASGAITNGKPVVVHTDGTVTIAAAGQTNILGIFNGCFYTDSNGAPNWSK